MADKESYLRMLPTGIREPMRKMLNKIISGDINMGTLTANITGNITGQHLLTLQSAEHGAGAIGTAFAPRTYRGYMLNGDIVTSIHVDLTGLACKGTAANDVIGLAAGGAAYIGRYVVATCGVIYRVEAICLETPGEGTATITTDIDIAANASGTLEYDGAAGAAECNLGGIAAGCSYVVDAPALTANDYIYLVEGDTTADTGVYNAGQLIINLYGHPVLS